MPRFAVRTELTGQLHPSHAMAFRAAFCGSRALVQTCRVLSRARKAETPCAPSPVEMSSTSGRSGYKRKPTSPRQQQNGNWRAHGKFRSGENAIERLERAEQSGRRASPKLYTSAISTYGKRKQWRKSIELLKKMETKGVAPDVITYNAAIKACAD